MARAAAALDLSGFGLERVSYIGQGHFATVQLVREVDSGQTYVAKCVRLGQLNERDRTLAKQEVFLLEALHHPLIVAYHDSFLLEGQDITLVILMEHCEGGDLRHAIAARAEEGGQFSEEQVLTWFSQVSLALEYTHQRKVVHRDLKCSNIFLVGSVLKLGDFGISRVFESSTDQCNTLVGTPYYMSPEVCSNRPYSYKSDIWSLGCVLYELCMLKHAFEHSTLQGLIHRIKSGTYEPVSPAYSQELRGLAGSLLTVAPEQRPSIEDVRAVPFLQTFFSLSHGELPGLPALDVEARQRSKHLRRLKSGLSSKELSAPADGPPALEPQDMSLIVAFRVQRHLAEQGQGALAALEPYAEGQSLTRESVREALQALGLRLSAAEVSIFEAALPRSDDKTIPLAAVEAKLEDARACKKMEQLHAWARKALRSPASRLLGSMEARDAQHSGFLPSSEFQAALVELAPHLSSEESMIMLLLADKSASGDAEYATFASRFGIAGAPEDTAFYTCAAEDIQVAAAVRNAWG